MADTTPILLPTHPCQRCGACCASFVVAFHWSETEIDASTGALAVPAALTEPIDPHRLAMRGTFHRAPRCVALHGDVGRHASCTIYPQRPSPCRTLQPAWEFGAPSPQCDRARARHGLAPLRPEDWQERAAVHHSVPVVSADLADRDR